MSEAPLITVITPTYNRCTVLLRANESVRKQDLQEYQHIIVDDGSADGTAKAVRSIGDPRIRLIVLPEWQGANIARNRGIADSESNLITFLDSDDEFLPDRLSSTVRFFGENPGVDFHISSFMTHKGDKPSSCINRDVVLTGSEWEEALVAHAVFIAGSAITIRKHVLESVGGFDPEVSRMQDRDLLLRLSIGRRVRLCSRINWIKHRSDDSISGPRADYLAALSRLLTRHETIAQRYRNLIGYLVAREILSNLLQGDWGNFYRGLRENCSHENFRFSLLGLISNYRSGKQRRREILNTMRSGSE